MIYTKEKEFEEKFNNAFKKYYKESSINKDEATQLAESSQKNSAQN